MHYSEHIAAYLLQLISYAPQKTHTSKKNIYTAPEALARCILIHSLQLCFSCSAMICHLFENIYSEKANGGPPGAPTDHRGPPVVTSDVLRQMC